MANRVLYTGTRYRVGDENFQPPVVNGLPYRLKFYDSTTSEPKEVWSGPEDADASLGDVVLLDIQGYVPVSGVWLDEGKYNIHVEYALTMDPVDDDDWGILWAINKVNGYIASSSSSSVDLQMVSSMADLRALDNDDLGGVVFMTGWSSLNDGGQGMFIWKESSLATDDGGAYAKPINTSVADPGRWFRVFADTTRYSVQLWGAVSTATNASGNIIAAENYLSASERCDATIVFPGGDYNMGVNAVTLDRSTIKYEIMNNAKFTGTNTLTIGNACDIKSAGYVYNKLILLDSQVNNGLAKAEWWGANGNNSFDNTETFDNIWTGIGNHTLLLDGEYKFSTLGYGGITQASPTLRFLGLDSRLFADFYGDWALSIGKIETINSHQVLDGAIPAFLLSDETYLASEIGVGIINWFNGVYNAFTGTQYTLLVDIQLEFTSSKTYSDRINMIMVDDGLLTIGDEVLTFDKISSRTSSKIFARTTSGTGSIEGPTYFILQPEWFGTSVDELNFLFACMEVSNTSVDFKNMSITTSESLNIVTKAGTSCVISNLILLLDGTVDMINISGEYASLTFRDCTIARNISGSLTIVNAVQPVAFDNCIFYNGKISSVDTYLQIKRSQMYGCSVEIEGAGVSSANANKLASNSFFNTQIICSTGSGGILGNLHIAFNDFHWSSVNASGAFITVQSNVLEGDFDNFRINNNTYNYEGFALVGDIYYDYTDLMVSVDDISATPGQGWNTHGTMDIIIEDLGTSAELSATLFTRLYGVNGHDYPNKVSTKNTVGTFVISNGDTTATAVQINEIPSSSFILNGRPGRLVAISLSVTSYPSTIVEDSYVDGKPGVAGCYQNNESTFVDDKLHIAVDYPNGIPHSEGVRTMVSGTFIKVFTLIPVSYSV